MTDEKHLVRDCLAGDEEAWKRFVQVYSPMARHAIGKVLARGGGERRRQETEEVLSDLFAWLVCDDYRPLREFRGECRLGTWIWTVARSRALLYLRETGRHVRQEEAAREKLDWTGRFAREEGLPLEREEELRLLDDALKQLSNRERIALRWFYEFGRSHAQIARLLHVSEAYAPQLLYEARRKLKTFLQKST